MADAKVTALIEVSVPALEDLLYSVDDPSGSPVSVKVSANRFLAQLGVTPGGRLTLTTGTPVTTADVTAAGTLYYTPYLHDRIRIFDGTRWKYYVFTERSLSLTLTSGENYDVFIYDNAGTLTLELSGAWTNDTTRADALTTQDSVYVKSGAATRLWLGTIRASGTNTTEDSAGGTTTQVGGKRYVWNYYNRVARHLRVIDTTDSWAYATNTIRQANGASGNKVEYVCGLNDQLVVAQALGLVFIALNSARAAKVGVGVDSTSAFSGHVQGGFNTNSGLYAPVTGTYRGYPGIGYHYLSWNEKGADGTSTFLGDNGGDSQQAGLSAQVFA